jgi:hormone-sensitive lipase
MATTAIIEDSLKSKSTQFITFLKLIHFKIYNLFRENKMKNKTNYLFSDVSISKLKRIYSIADNKFVNFLMGLYLVSIPFAKALYIPVMLKPLDLCHYKIGHIQIEDYQLKVQSNYTFDKKQYNPQLSIKIRLFYPYTLPIKGKYGDWQHTNEVNAIVIYIHGGGFISLSSKSQQGCIRKWANEAKVAVFSIDYRLAPEHSYPDALNDCLNAYFWILNYSYQHLGIKANKIVLAGDSAGAGLALAVTLRVINSNLAKPIGVLIANPALNLSVSGFTPSVSYSLTDPVLRHSMLLGVVQSYVGSGNADEDPYLSPIFICNKDILQFPPLRIMIAEKDPLCDESINLALKFA